jgi:hypothetical protein
MGNGDAQLCLMKNKPATMKHLVTLLIFAIGSIAHAQTPGQNSLERKPPTGNGSIKENFTLGNSQILGRTAAGVASGFTLGSGLTLSGTTLSASSSSAAWADITGKPTTLAGFGITDAITAATAASTYLPLAGGTLTGELIGTSAQFTAGAQILGNLFAGAGVQIGGTLPEIKFELPGTTGFGTGSAYFRIVDPTVEMAESVWSLRRQTGTIAFTSDLNALDASNLTSGTIPNARFPATLPAANGSALTALNASNITSGTLPSARLGQVGANGTWTSPNITVDIYGRVTSAINRTATQIIDTIGSTQGHVLFRGASAWTALAPGTNGQVLTSGGAGANPTWTTVSGGGLTIGSTAITGGTSSRVLMSGTTVSEQATTGTGDIVRASSPTLVTPALGTPSSVNLTNGTALPVAGIVAADFERAMVTPNSWLIPWDAWSTQTVSGSGSTSASGWGLNCQTGTTAGSRAQRALSIIVGDHFWGQPNTSTNQVNWAKRFTIGFTLNPVSSSTNGQWFFRLGDLSGNTGNLSGMGIGIRMNNGVIVGQVHNGTTLTTSSTLKTATMGTNQSTWVVIQSDGAGNVQFWIDNALAATLTGGPTTPSVSAVAVESLNNADTSSTRVHLSPIKVFITP